MSEPRRFLKDGGGFEQSLLRSAREDRPSPGSRQRTMAALGIGAGVIGAGATATATAAASTATPAVKAAASLGLLKWIGVGLAGGALVVGAAEITHSVAPQPTHVTSVAPEEHVRAPIAARRAPAANTPSAVDDAAKEPVSTAIEAPPTVASPAVIATVAAPIAEAPRPRAASPSPASSALAEEIAALDGAREALASGDASRALRALDARDRAFPRGALGPEAMVLRIEALALRGDRATATRLAEAFLAASPRSPHASRIRTLLGLTAPAPEPAP
jgi:outer membrane lipoprotein YfiO